MKLNYNSTFGSIVLLRNSSGPFNYSGSSGKALGGLESTDALKTLRYSPAALPNILVIPRMLYNYTIEFSQPCSDPYLILNFTFTIEGVRDLKVLIENDIIFEKVLLLLLSCCCYQYLVSVSAQFLGLEIVNC